MTVSLDTVLRFNNYSKILINLYGYTNNPCAINLLLIYHHTLRFELFRILRGIIDGSQQFTEDFNSNAHTFGNLSFPFFLIAQHLCCFRQTHHKIVFGCIFYFFYRYPRDRFVKLMSFLENPY